jgi:hypothetical protein
LVRDDFGIAQRLSDAESRPSIVEHEVLARPHHRVSRWNESRESKQQLRRGPSDREPRLMRGSRLEFCYTPILLKLQPQTADPDFREGEGIQRPEMSTSACISRPCVTPHFKYVN